MTEPTSYDEYGFVAELYDHVVPYRDREDIDFYLEQAQRAGGPVLEVGCGTGRVLLPIARAGIEIIGMDASQGMLTVCRNRLDAEPAEVKGRVELLEADMRDFDLGRQFRLITIPFRPFQHLETVDEQMSCLKAIHRHLADDGAFVLDIFNPWLDALTKDNLGEEYGEEPEFILEDGRRVVRVHKVVERDLHNQLIYNELIYYVTHPDGSAERLVHTFTMRYLFRFEAEHLLARSGYEIESLYANYDLSTHADAYPGELIFVAKKVSLT
jgi:SAM-dependent methyltransferase